MMCDEVLHQWFEQCRIEPTPRRQQQCLIEVVSIGTLPVEEPMLDRSQRHFSCDRILLCEDGG